MEIIIAILSAGNRCQLPTPEGWRGEPAGTATVRLEGLPLVREVPLLSAARPC